ncbi:4Fe-4S binding protein [Desulfurobacterium sp.]
MNIRKIRWLVQTAFFLLVVYGIYEYAQFVYYGAARPDFMDGFCPISGVYDIIMKIRSGVTDPFHPAAMAIMVAAIVTTFIFGKGFCSFICPVGTLQDYITFVRNKLSFFKKIDNVGEKIKSWKFYNFIDYPLRSIKFVLLAWILYIIFQIPAQMMAMMNQNINAAADIELFKFWIELFKGDKPVVALILVTIVVFSVIIPRFWCKYLCPLGAFYGIFNLFSFTHLRRCSEKCNDCKLCSKCIIGLKPYKSIEFNNTECTMCLDCRSACNKDAVRLQILGREIPSLLYPVLLVGAFMGVIFLFMHFGVWHSQLSQRDEAYLILKQGFNVEWAKELLMK